MLSIIFFAVNSEMKKPENSFEADQRIVVKSSRLSSVESTKALDDYAAYTITQLQIIIAACQTRFGFISAGEDDSGVRVLTARKTTEKPTPPMTTTTTKS